MYTYSYIDKCSCLRVTTLQSRSWSLCRGQGLPPTSEGSATTVNTLFTIHLFVYDSFCFLRFTFLGAVYDLLFLWVTVDCLRFGIRVDRCAEAQLEPLPGTGPAANVGGERDYSNHPGDNPGAKRWFL